MSEQHQLYEPINQLKLIADDIWMVDGPIIQMDFPFGLKIPFPTRMVVVRLKNGALWVYSPIAPDEGLFRQIDALGKVAYLIAPNSIHYWFVPDWLEQYPKAEVHAITGLAETAKKPLHIDRTLGEAAPEGWADEIKTVIFNGSVVNEAVFLHRPSSTLLLCDLIENFEAKRIRNPFLRLLMKLAGILDPDGKAPRDYRLTFWRNRKEFAQKVLTMIGWEPDQVIMTHGRPYLENGTAELKRAFRWVKGVK